jgi:hypothetical protein
MTPSTDPDERVSTRNGNNMTRLALGPFTVLSASLGANGQSKIYVERDGLCSPTSWNGNTVQCNAWGRMMACDQQKVN